MLAQPPDISLVTSQTCAVDTALLTSSDTNGLTVLYIAYRVTLSVLQGDKGDNQVALSLWSKGLVLSRHILEECIVVELDLVAALLEGDAEYLLALDWLRYVCRINLDYVICTLALVLVKSGAITPSLTSRFSSFAVVASQVSERATKSP